MMSLVQIIFLILSLTEIADSSATTPTLRTSSRRGSVSLNSTRLTNSTLIQERISKIQLNHSDSTSGRSLDDDNDDFVKHFQHSQAATQVCSDMFSEDVRWQCTHFSDCCGAACAYFHEESDSDCILKSARRILIVKCICAPKKRDAVKSPKWPSNTKPKAKPKSNIKKKCGMPAIQPSSNRIYGGDEANPHSWPWQISLRLVSQNMTHHGGGSIINENHILTAAHCIESLDDKINKTDYRVAVGLHNVNHLKEGALYEISSILLHPKRDTSKSMRAYDYAILRLSRDITFSDNVVPICLPQTPPNNKSECVATGWGKTEKNPLWSEKLRQVQLPIIDPKVCNDKEHHNGQIDASMLCASSPNKDACNGDSGGPFACKRADNSWELQGITSWSGMFCGQPDKPGVFANVFYVMNWIEQNL